MSDDENVDVYGNLDLDGELPEGELPEEESDEEGGWY